MHSPCRICTPPGCHYSTRYAIIALYAICWLCLHSCILKYNTLANWPLHCCIPKYNTLTTLTLTLRYTGVCTTDKWTLTLLYTWSILLTPFDPYTAVHRRITPTIDPYTAVHWCITLTIDWMLIDNYTRVPAHNFHVRIERGGRF